MTDKKLIKPIEDLIFTKGRFNRFELLNFLNSKMDGKYKNIKLKFLEDSEYKLAKKLSEHIETCSFNNAECPTEKVYNRALKVIEIKKEEILSKKSFWENVLSNPVGLGILIIGLGNLIIAIINIFKIFIN